MLGDEPIAPETDSETAPDYGDDLDGEFRAGILEAFPELSDAQLGALKAAIEACVEATSDKSKSGPLPPKGKGGLALIFGKGK